MLKYIMLLLTLAVFTGCGSTTEKSIDQFEARLTDTPCDTNSTCRVCVTTNEGDLLVKSIYGVRGITDSDDDYWTVEADLSVTEEVTVLFGVRGSAEISVNGEVVLDSVTSYGEEKSLLYTLLPSDKVHIEAWDGYSYAFIDATP